MDIILQILKNKISLDEDIYALIDIITKTENNQIKFQNFNKLLEISKKYIDYNSKKNVVIEIQENSVMEINNFFTALLTLYNFNCHKDFKHDLINLLKSSKMLVYRALDIEKSIFDKVVQDYLEHFDFSIKSESTDYMRIKLKIFISYFDFIKNYSNFIENEKTKFLLFKNFKNLLRDMDFHLKTINDDVFQHLIMFFKFLNIFYKKNYYYTIDQELIDLVDRQLLMYYENLKQVQFCKDYEYNLANCYFQLSFIKIKKNSNEQNSMKNFKQYVDLGKSLFQKFSNDAFKVLLYFKAFIINIDRENYLNEVIQTLEPSNTIQGIETNSSYNFLKIIQDNYFIKNNQGGHIDDENLTFLKFYNNFLINDLKLNLTSLINEIFLSIVNKSNIGTFRNVILDEIYAKEPKSLIYNYLLNENVIEKIFLKLEKDKNYFNIMDDFYYFIIEELYSCNLLKEKIQLLCYKYLKNILDNKCKIMLIEVNLFKFLDLENEKNTSLVKDFFHYIFSRKFHKRHLNLLNEYIKIMCDFFFKKSEYVNNQTENKIFEDKYSKFIDVFCESFFNYLQRIEGKSMKHFKNIFINLEKFNKNLYSLIVNQFFEKYMKHNSNENIEFNRLCKDYMIFILLLKPFKNHKRAIKIVEGDHTKTIVFKFEIFKNYKEITFSLDFKDFSHLVRSADRYLIIYIIEFLIGMESEENVFEVIYNVLKYNLKSSFVEYKSFIMKSLSVYFSGYINKIARLLSNKEKSAKLNSKIHNHSYYNSEDKIFLTKTENNLTKLLRLLSENIYDRPVENLLCYLDILKHILQKFEVIYDIVKNVSIENINTTREDNLYFALTFKNIFEKYIFNKGLAFSLISLLRQSWALVRLACFSILKSDHFKSVINNEKEILIDEILRNVNSLRQMDAEGSINLFLLMTHHLSEEFLDQFLNKLIAKNDIKYTKYLFNKADGKNDNDFFSDQKIILANFIEIIKSKKEDYFTFVNSNANIKKDSLENNFLNKEYYIHSYFIFIKSSLEEIKESPQIFIKNSENNNDNHYQFIFSLVSLSDLILNLNFEFRKFLINNGVSEFITSSDETGGNDMLESEDKRLISLWISTKYSLECLNLCFEIINNLYKFLPKNENFGILLKNIKQNVSDIIDLMIDYKHMGAICGLNQSLLSACKIVI